MKRNNRMMKIAVSVLLMAATVLCMSACGARTVSVDDASGAAGALTWKYEKETKTLTVTGNGEMPNAESAADVAWASVRDGVQKIVVSAGVTTVGDYAFYGMSYAKEIVLPSTLTSIGKYAFGFCSAVEGIQIPDGVVAIGDSAFEACTSLKTIVLSPAVTGLGARAFALCSSLTDATVVANVTEIGAETFYNCKALNNLILHTSVQSAHESAFALAGKGFADAERRDTVAGTYEIVITYVYEDGTEAAPAIQEEKLNGENYLHISPAIEGFTPDKSEVQGTLAGAAVRETVTYKKNVETEPAETEPVETTPVVEPEEEKSRGELIVSVVVLAVVVIGIAVGAFLLLRGNKKDAKNSKNAPKNGKKK